jgi:diguanylate cyclase (GGDEF)-like protein/PAS domain S-box-containing protein
MPGKRLLIVDDSPDVHELVRVWLAGEPLEFCSCTSGQEALRIAPSLRPDLILLDVDMPGMDGFEVCKRLKSDQETVDIPVIFLTGASATEEKLRGLELGASDYLIKPFDPAELRARVRSSLQTKRLLDLLAQKALVLKESEERFRILAENSSDVISRHTPDGIFLYVSPACIAMLGYTPDKLQGQTLYDFVHPDDLEAVTERYSQRREHGATGTVEFRFKRQDGQWIWLESTCRTLMDERGGAVREIHASARDISLRKQMDVREQVRAEVLEMIAQARPLNDVLRRLTEEAERQEPQVMAAGVMVVAGVVHHYAPSLPTNLGGSIERQLYALVARFNELTSQSHDRVICCDLLNDPAWRGLRSAVVEQRLRSCWAIMIRSRHCEAAGAFLLYRSDQQRPTASAIELMKLASELTSVALEHRDLTDQLTFQAHHDALTQLPNRVLFGDWLQQAIAATSRNNRPAAVLLVDVDRFKYVNDTFGHQAGDEMLCQVAHRIRRRLRASDMLARMGGDEFAAVLTELTAPEDVNIVAKSLVDEFKTPIDLRGRDLFITISIGAAVFPRDGTDAASLLKNADLALYRAKDAGRNTSRSFSPEMSEVVTARLDMENALRQALANHELCLFYQPQVNAIGKIVGVEALIRWEHPTLGMVPPVKFIPLAEETGVILPVGKWVLQEAARQVRAWADAKLPLIPISVNVSTLQFAQPDFLQTVSAALQSAGLEEPWLELELTESLLMKNMRDAADKLASLKQMKVRVAIDDFGTGYSSLAYLQRLSLDTLKIDFSFINMMDINLLDPTRGPSNGKTIVGAIVALAKSLGLSVVAEGVETEAQWRFLVRLGCDVLQGFLFSTPQTADQTEQLIRKQLILPAIPLAKSA